MTQEIQAAAQVEIQKEPLTLRIGSFDFELDLTPEVLVDGNYGDIDYARQKIRIAHNLTPAMLHNTLWHEVIHAILYNAGFRDHDEQLIEVLSNGIRQVLRDNLWLAEPLLEVKLEEENEIRTCNDPACGCRHDLRE